MATNIQDKTLYYGDCLEWMKEFPDECVDLIYLDPPFNSDAHYNQIFRDQETNGIPAQFRAFEDTWTWGADAFQRVTQISNAVGHPAHKAIKGLFEVLGKSGMMSYLSYMAERLVEMRRLLKPKGSIYLHCDPTASHYLKVLMDTVFGSKNFRNEIAWHYPSMSRTLNYYPKKHDVIFLYSGSDEFTFNWQDILVPYAPETLARAKYGGAGFARKEGKSNYLQREGKIPDTVWDIPHIKSKKEHLGYPTQKPLAILERIIKASSKEGDFVLDPFCGCGTAVIAANNLGRKWAGIDISSFAIDVVHERRLAPQGVKPTFAGIPSDLASARKLAKSKPFDFETWAIQRVDGLAPNQVQVRDGGIDGRGTFDPPQKDRTEGLTSKKVVAQVKSGKFSLSQLRDFLNVVEQDKFGFGIYITLDKVTSKDARARIAEFGTVKVDTRNYPRIQFWSIEEYFEGAKPDLPPLLDPYTGKRQAQDVQFDENETDSEPKNGQNGRFEEL